MATAARPPSILARTSLLHFPHRGRSRRRRRPTCSLARSLSLRTLSRPLRLFLSHSVGPAGTGFLTDLGRVSDRGRPRGRTDVAFFSCPLNSASAFAPAAVSLPPAAPLCTPCRAARSVSLLAPEHLPLVVVVAPGLLSHCFDAFSRRAECAPRGGTTKDGAEFQDQLPLVLTMAFV